MYKCDILAAHTSSKVRYSRHFDILTACGFLASLQACRRLVRGALCWIGVPCSSWIWLSRGSTKRCRLRPQGNRRYKKVKESNRLVRRILYLFLGGFNTCQNMFHSESIGPGMVFEFLSQTKIIQSDNPTKAGIPQEERRILGY